MFVVTCWDEFVLLHRIESEFGLNHGVTQTANCRHIKNIGVFQLDVKRSGVSYLNTVVRFTSSNVQTKTEDQDSP